MNNQVSIPEKQARRITQTANTSQQARREIFLPRIGVWLVILLVVGLMSGVLLLRIGAPSNPTHLIVTSPICGVWESWEVPDKNPPGASSLSAGWDEYDLRDVDAVGPNDVWAVGYKRGSSQSRRPSILIQHWNGAEWSSVEGPDLGPEAYDNFLYAVEAVSQDDVWAVGHFGGANGIKEKPLILHWDGVQWSIVATPVPRWTQESDPQVLYTHLEDVVAVSKNDVWAVGGDSGETLTLHWDGVTWSVVPSPSPGEYRNHLYSVTALRSNNVWAAGRKGGPQGDDDLIMQWDGVQWRVVPSTDRPESLDPNSSHQLFALSAISDKDIWATGLSSRTEGTETLVEAFTQHWDGSVWTMIPNSITSRQEEVLSDIVSDGETGFWAVGYSGRVSLSAEQTLVKYWNGQEWQIVASPQLHGKQAFMGVTALSDGSLWAVGYTEGEALAARFSRKPCSDSN